MMTDYKVPFNTIGPFHPVYDAMGRKVNAQYMVDALNAHARQSAQRCETCRENNGHCVIQNAAQIYADSLETFGCRAHQPKENE